MATHWHATMPPMPHCPYAPCTHVRPSCARSRPVTAAAMYPAARLGALSLLRRIRTFLEEKCKSGSPPVPGTVTTPSPDVIFFPAHVRTQRTLVRVNEVPHTRTWRMWPAVLEKKFYKNLWSGVAWCVRNVRIWWSMEPWRGAAAGDEEDPPTFTLWLTGSGCTALRPVRSNHFPSPACRWRGAFPYQGD